MAVWLSPCRVSPPTQHCSSIVSSSVQHHDAESFINDLICFPIISTHTQIIHKSFLVLELTHFNCSSQSSQLKLNIQTDILLINSCHNYKHSGHINWLNLIKISLNEVPCPVNRTWPFSFSVWRIIFIKIPYFTIIICSEFRASRKWYFPENLLSGLLQCVSVSLPLRLHRRQDVYLDRKHN